MSLDPNEIREIAAEGYADPVFFCKFFLPHLFPGRIPWVHRGLLAILLRRGDFLLKYGELEKIASNFVWHEEPGNRDSAVHPIFDFSEGRVKMTLSRFTLIMLPRGFSKTTLAGIAVPLMDVCYQEVPFEVYVSESGTHSNMQAANVRRELETNTLLIEVFGEQKPGMQDPQVWRQDFFETLSGCAIAARGRGGQIRGLNHRGRRPGKINVDDVEDKESVSTDEQRMKTAVWAYGDLLPALPEMDPTASLVALGTILHSDALLVRWMKDKNFTVVKFGAHDLQGDLLWPEMMDEGKLQAKKEQYASQGLLHIFYMEYYNEVTPSDLVKFRPEFIRYDRPGPEDPIHHTAIYCDPAISGKVGADFCAIVVCGISKKGLIYVLETWFMRGAKPEDTLRTYFDLAKRFRCHRHGIESNAYQAALIHIAREWMFREGYYFEPIPVTHSNKKDERILGVLQPRYASGYIVHTKPFPILETQLLGYPNEKKDGPDALAGCVALLDPYAAHAAGTIDLGKDEYEEIEDMIGGSWQVAV